MKKKLFLVLSMIVLLVCIFAITASAALNKQDTNAFGEISLFDESISVGRTNTKYGFTPYIDAEGTTYARVVVGSGTEFYTFPTAYILSDTTVYGSEGNNIFVWDLTSLNSAMAAETGTDPGWTVLNIYRIEMPNSVTRVNGDSKQKFAGFENVIEIYLQPNSAVNDANKTMIFWHCYNLEKIHNLDTFVFSAGSLGGSFQECKKLTSLTIGKSEDVTTTDNNVFNGCTFLTSVNIAEAFPNLTIIGNSMFKGCTSLTSFEIPGTIKTIDAYAFSGSGLTSIVIPDSVTSVGTRSFQYCPSLEKVHFGAKGHDVTFGDNIFGTDNNKTQNTVLRQVTFEEDSGITTLGVYMFYSCTSLEYLSLPDSITEFKSGALYSCSSLGPIHLPANLQTISQAHGTFLSCNNLYFVNDFFTDPETVEKPEIYYFPDCITSITCEMFKYCWNMNDTLVFGKSLTSVTQSYAFARKNASTTRVQNIVFLGDVTQLPYGGDGYYTNYYVAGANATVTPSTNGTSNLYVCNAEATTHLYLIYKETEATCIEDGARGYVCFCGTPHEDTEVVKALGHTEGEVISIAYANGFYALGVLTYDCTVCEENGTKEAPALVTDNGYSTDGASVTHGFEMDWGAIEAYESANNVTVTTGLFVALGTASADGKLYQDGSFVANVLTTTTSTKYDLVDIKLVNITATENTDLYLGMYLSVKNNETEEETVSLVDKTGDKGATATTYTFEVAVSE